MGSRVPNTISASSRLLLGVVIATMCGCSRIPRPTGKVVDIEQMKIKSIHGRLFANSHLFQQNSDYVLIPARHHDLITALLCKPVLDKYHNPKICAEICRLRIVDAEDKETEIMIWWQYKRVILFSLDGQTPLTRSGIYGSLDDGQSVDEAAALDKLVKAIIEKNEEDEEWAQDRLKKSVGISK